MPSAICSYTSNLQFTMLEEIVHAHNYDILTTGRFSLASLKIKLRVSTLDTAVGGGPQPMQAGKTSCLSMQSTDNEDIKGTYK